MPATPAQLADLAHALTEAWGRIPAAWRAGRDVFDDWPGNLEDAGERAACWDTMTRAALRAAIEQHVNPPAPEPASQEEPCRSRD